MHSHKPSLYLLRINLFRKAWGLRFYGKKAETIWGGDSDCDHVWGKKIKNPKADFRTPEQMLKQGASVGNSINSMNTLVGNMGSFCSKCGAWKGQLGLEPSYKMYIEHMIQITLELKRVLKPTGTFWLNIGQTYASEGGPTRHFGYSDPKYGNKKGGNYEEPQSYPQGIPPKSIMQIPERLSTRMVDEQGWILRNIIIWNKNNAMPSSTTDRLTTSYEYVYFFVKNKKYFFNPEAVKEPTADGKSLRNGRDVWTINTKPYKGLHFAPFPLELPEKCIKAGCPKNGIVLDPFAGSGTTLKAALDLGMDGIGIEINPKYVKLIEERLGLKDKKKEGSINYNLFIGQ